MDRAQKIETLMDLYKAVYDLTLRLKDIGRTDLVRIEDADIGGGTPGEKVWRLLTEFQTIKREKILNKEYDQELILLITACKHLLRI